MLCYKSLIFAHPHVFPRLSFEIISEEGKITGVKEIWTFDEMYGTMIISTFDIDGDLKFNEEESKKIKERFFWEFADCLTYVSGDVKSVEVKGIEDFQLKIIDESLLECSFIVPVERKIKKKNKISIYVTDPSIYTSFEMDYEPLRNENKDYVFSYDVFEETSITIKIEEK